LKEGGFNAEYGQVRSGIVNVVTREGSKKEYSEGLNFDIVRQHENIGKVRLKLKNY
jgi:hypothetical protein